MNCTSIILGYGVFVTPDPGYQQYLETALNEALNNKSAKIITCGGFTNPKYPQLSEAGSIKKLFLESHPELSSVIIAESQSLTTPQNLEFSQPYINPGNIFIYCDSIRVPKVFYLAISLYFKNLSEKAKIEIMGKIYVETNPDVSQNVVFSYQNITVVGIPLSDTLKLTAHQILSSMLEMHAFDYPDLHQQFIDYRRQKFGLN